MDGFKPTGVALVIGSASGIGRATALAFARYGAVSLVVADINESGVQETAKQAKRLAINPDFAVLSSYVDVRSYESVESLVEKTTKRFGRIDYSVTTAGIYPPSALGLIADRNLADYDNIQDTNAKGVLHHTKAVVQAMLRQESVVIQGRERVRVLGRGSIVNICSAAGIQAIPGSVAYNASKFAAVGITKTAANEYGASQIRVNAICPGAIDTPLLERGVAASPNARVSSIRGTPLGRIGDTDEVADAIIFLCAPAGSYVHGTTMLVDGGLTNNVPVSFI